ncbi:hypothetical protein D3C80_1839110 [compost metagenome]
MDVGKGDQALDFLVEARAGHVRVGAEPGIDLLEGDHAVELGVGGGVEDRVQRGAHDAFDPVMPDHLAGREDAVAFRGVGHGAGL